VGDALFLVIFFTAGFAPLVAKPFMRTRMALLVGLAWLIAWGVFLLRPGANSPHTYGLFFFLVFFIEWLGAMAVIWINRDHTREIAK